MARRLYVFLVPTFVFAIFFVVQSKAHGDRVSDQPTLQVEMRQGVPVFDGNSYERGLKHGQLYRDEIKQLLEAIYDSHLDTVWARLWANFQSRRMEAQLPEFLTAEMHGVADGAGVAYRDIVVGNVFPDLAWLSGESLACSTFLVLGDRAPAGSMLYGRNLDWTRDLAPLFRRAVRPMIFAAPDKLQVLSVGLPGMIGLLTGINEAGVAASIMYSSHEDQTPDGFPMTLLYRRVLSEATDFATARDQIIGTEPRTIAVNTMLADGIRGAVLETTATKSAVREPGASGIVYAANHFESPSLIGSGSPDRDYRWPTLSRFDRTRDLISLSQLRGVIAAAAMDDETWTNTKAVLIDYGTGQLLWGTGGPPAAAAPMQSIDLDAIF